MSKTMNKTTDTTTTEAKANAANAAAAGKSAATGAPGANGSAGASADIHDTEANGTVNERVIAVARESGDFLRGNAVPIALVAAGVGMLAMRTVNGGDNRAAHAVEQARGKAVETATTVREGAGIRARQVGEKVRNGSGAVRRNVGNGVAQSQEVVRTHPVATGLAAAAIGAGVAAAVRRWRA
ncbi:hypothetical protein KAJ83_08525 [Marivibrio halodurans]|uniref:Uncharacterized protein n=1 Tax=Marivibrio halodurans TaxID=2039722 RepID=A0A8J7V2D3_9PROT|nr:hypothetical protein [Marivibrio halodurans]MBP5857051.1 hypothetical protein [Marivibrio halodurans]